MKIGKDQKGFILINYQIIAIVFSITLYYSLSNVNNNINIDDYIYDNNTEKRIKFTNTVTFNAYITLETMGDMISKNLKIDNIVNVDPFIKFGNISQ